MIVSANNLHEYFREALGLAMRRTSLQVTENTQAYLVYLLSNFTRSENVYAGVEHGDKPTLALLLSRAQEAEPEEALRIFKHLGDSALYLLGFFHDAVKNQAVGAGYYISMGESAYFSAASLTRVPRENALIPNTIYAELAHRFGDLVDLLKIMSLHGNHLNINNNLSSEQVMELAERYRKTKNPELLEFLERNGVSLSQSDADVEKKKQSTSILLH
jgi:hypothetical protein